MSASLLLVALQGCTEDQTSTKPPRSGVSMSSADASPDRTDPSSSVPSTAVSTPARAGATACLAQERRAASGVAYRLQGVDRALGSSTGSSVGAGQRVEDEAELAEQAVVKVCDRLSAAMRTFLRVTHQRSSDGLTPDDLDAVVSAFAAWGRSVGADNATRETVSAFHGCRTLRDGLTTSYQAWWRWNGTGRDWWVELTFRNELRRTLHASLRGRARITHGSGSSTPPGSDRRSRTLQWGASSWDYATIPPGTSRHVLPLGPDYDYRYVATGPSETLHVLDAGVSVQSDAAGLCEVPVTGTP